MKFLRINALFQEIEPRPHDLGYKNGNRSDDTVKAAKLTELDDQLCGEQFSYEAESHDEDSLVALHEMERGRRYISRAIAACAFGAINRNCPAP